MKFKEAIYHAVEQFDSPEFIQNRRNEDESMLAHMNILKDINRLGYITHESQAGRKSSGIVAFQNNNAAAAANKNENEGKPFETTERAYISGFMLKEDAKKFIKEIGLYTDKLAFLMPYCDDDFYDYTPPSLDIPLTVDIIDGITNIRSRTSVALPRFVWEDNREKHNIDKSEDVVFIFCIDMIWNRDASSPSGLFTDVLQALQKINAPILNGANARSRRRHQRHQRHRQTRRRR